ncbi:MAG: hypothetical protein P8X67_13320 [Syntrophobacterales bacterium]|jgi:hypothetical protein
MAEELERPMAEDELGTMTQTITLKKRPLPDGVPDPRPKVKYVAIKKTSVLKILGAVVDALQQKGLQDKADELRKLVLGGSCETNLDALELIGQYARLAIVDEEGKEIGRID